MRTKGSIYSVIIYLILAVLVDNAFPVPTNRKPKVKHITDEISMGGVGEESYLPPPNPILKYLAEGEKYEANCTTIMPEAGKVIQHDQIGTTWYDFQQNGSMGRLISVTDDGYHHFSWMYTDESYTGSVSRYVDVNCSDPLDNYIGQRHSDGGTTKAGYCNQTHLHDGSSLLVHHRTAGSPIWYCTLTLANGLGSTLFDRHWDIPDYISNSPSGVPGEWPQAEVLHDTATGKDYIHVVMTEGNTSGGVPVMVAYERCYIKDGPGLLDTMICQSYQSGSTKTYKVIAGANGSGASNLISHFDSSCSITPTVTVSHFSHRVAIAYLKPSCDGSCNYLSDICYIESMVNGDEWVAGSPWPPPERNITNFGCAGSERGYSDLSACYDYKDSLHIVYVTAGFDPANPAYYVPSNTHLYHWSKKTGTGMITSKIQENTNPGAHNLNIAKMSISAQNPIYHAGGDSVYLFCIWTQFDSSDQSANGFGNGDLFGCYSSDGGANWRESYNLTNTHTPNCAPGNCLSEHWSSLAQNIHDGNLHIQYICDKDAGGAIQDSPSAWLENPVMYLCLSDWSKSSIQQTITLTSPNGGDTLCIGADYNISWTLSAIDTIMIQYSTNGGSSWNMIIHTPASAGSYLWDIPNTPSNNCLIKVCDKDGDPCDQSNSFFTILTIPTAPVLISPVNGISNVNINPTHLSWNPDQFTTSYRLQIDSDSTFSSPEYDVSGIAATERDVYGLSYGTKYYWRVNAANVCGNDSWSSVRNFTTVSNSTPVDTIYKCNFEYGWSGWSVDNGVWEVGHDSTVGSHSISNCAGTVLNGNYPDDQNSHLISPPIVLPGIDLETQRLKLCFWHWFQMATHSWGNDQGQVQISVDSGGVWKPWETISNSFTPTGGVWSPYEVDISKYAGKRIHLGFYFSQYDYAGIGRGWYVDDVCVIRTSVCVSAPLCFNFEDGWSDWWTDNGVWEVGHPDTNILIPHSEQHCAGTVLNGNYPDDNNSRLVSPVICLPSIDSLDEGLYLRFWHWFQMATHSWGNDQGQVQISVDSGGIWKPWETISNNFTGTSAVWSPYEVDISKYIGKQVRLGFYFSQYIYTGTAKGWYVDDVCVNILRDTIIVISPNGGESWDIGISHTVNWNWQDWSGTFQYVKIELSRDGGNHWEILANNISNNGFWQGNIIGPTSDRCLIKISDAADGIPSDVSDGLFTIGGIGLTVTSPNGGEIWGAGEIDTIKWISSGIDTVKIEYTTDGGSSWNTIVAKTPSDGLHPWTVPNTPSVNCLVRISNTQGGSWDQSDSYFTISVKNITITSPTGGEKWCVGDIDTIKWSSTGIDSVKILYSTNGGSSWTSIIQKWPSNKGYPWTVPQTLSNNCLVKICNLDDSSCDQSDSSFSITTESLTLLSPNGSQSWLVGSSQDVTWQSDCIENVYISYSTNGGSNWSDIASQTPADGSYTWTVSDTPSDSCLVKICDVDGIPCDTSNSYFTITRKTLSLTSPKGGENWCANDTQQIIWASAYLDSVRIQYSTNGGTNWTTVVNCTTNTGHYSWKVPNVSSPSCRVKICDCDMNPCDESDSNFTIRTIPSDPALVTPSNGATNVSVDSTHFAWNASSGASSYRLQVDDDSTFADSECDTSGISNTSCDVYGLSCGVKHYWRVKAVNPCGESGWSERRHFTTITSNITITVPNGGESWSVGEVDTIKWTSSCVPNVGIYYSSNGGSIWTQIVQTIANYGQYIWTVPSVSSDSCKVKVMDATDGIPYDESDSSFAIKLPLATLKEYHPHLGDWIIYDSCLTLDFSRRMDPTTFDTNNITIRGVNGLIYKWSQATSDSQSFQICPDSGYYSLDTVTVRLKGTIKDSFGRCWDVNGDDKEDCDSTKSWSFDIWPLGDYNRDTLVNGDDVADFANAWNEQNTSKEIGPAVGTPPHLLCCPDGKVDFEDLVIFVWMWNWFHQNFLFSPPVEPEEGNGNSENLIAITPDSSIAKNEKKEFGLILEDTKDVMVLSIFVQYDPNKLRIESADAGSLFSSDDAPTLFLKSIDHERGIAEIASSRLKGNTGEVKGAKLAVKIRMRALAAINSELIAIHYKTWDFQAKPLYSGHSVFELNSPLSPPKNFKLFQNYPNPFNPQTSISYVLPIDSPVKITIYNIAGQNVKTILDEFQTKGSKLTYWDGTDDNGREVASGIYFCTLKAEEFSQTIKVILLR